MITRTIAIRVDGWAYVYESDDSDDGYNEQRHHAAIPASAGGEARDDCDD